jgi:hypothetical protein
MGRSRPFITVASPDNRGASNEPPSWAFSVAALEDGEARVTARREVPRPRRRVGAPAELQVRVAALQPQLPDTERIVVEAERDRPVVDEIVVQERQRRVVDPRVDRQLRWIRQWSADVERAARDRARVGRDLRREELQVRIDRALRKPPVQVRHRRLVQADTAPAVNVEQARHRDEPLDPQRPILDAHVALYLADALVADEQVVDRAAEAVARLIQLARA